MAYNKINKLQLIIDIQNIVLDFQEDHTNEWIYSKKIYPVYRISRRTFYNYLSINAKKELRELLG
ncbi:MAG: hypothetical protein MI784_01705 [Cytophagales bacterium]|nr:hypothetical protein [Cytophagales bacterium]